MELINNTTKTLKDDLSVEIKQGSKLSIAAACFSIYAFQELKEQLSQIEQLRFIFTSPTFVTEKAKKERREFYIPRMTRERSLYGTEFEIKLRNELTQKAIARECAEWIRQKVTFKSNISDKSIQGQIVVDGVGYTPINNFTTVELGCEKGNVISTTIVKDESLAHTLLADFNEIWNDSKVLQVVTDEVIDSITAAYNENSPDFIYFVTLYNIFNEFLEDVSEDVLPNEATGFKESKIWGMLYNFQKDAALAIINKLEKYNGCILADSVGLGKTFTALAVIKYYENRNKSVLVLCPKKLTNNGRFHTDWLNMIYPRLKLAKDLLTDDGVIFISIDDNEVENLIKCCNEIFGTSNFIANLIWKSKSGGANDSRYFAVDHEYIIVYAKSADKFELGIDKEATVTTTYNRKDEKGQYALDRLDKQSIRYSEALDYEIIGPDGTSYRPKHKDPTHPNATWRWSKKTVEQHYDDLVFENGCVYTKNYKKEGAIARSLLLEDRFGRTRTGKTDCFSLFNRDYFSNPKPYKLIRYLEIIASNKDSIILDFFSGSATTAHAVMQLNAEDGGHRKFIMVQLPEATDEKSEAYKAGYKTICEIGKERIRRAGRKIKEDSPLTTQGLDIGFRVLKRAD